MTTLKSLVDETTNIKDELVTCYTNLKNNLVAKNVPVSNTDKLSTLVSKIPQIKNMPKVVAGDVLNLIVTQPSYVSISSGSAPYGKAILGIRIFAEGSIRIKVSYNWSLSTVSKGSFYIVANRGGSDVVLHTSSFFGTGGNTSYITTDVNIQDGDLITMSMYQPYGTYPNAKCTDISCNLV